MCGLYVSIMYSHIIGKLIIHKSFSLKIVLSSFYILINFMHTNKDIHISLCMTTHALVAL